MDIEPCYSFSFSRTLSPVTGALFCLLGMRARLLGPERYFPYVLRTAGWHMRTELRVLLITYKRVRCSLMPLTHFSRVLFLFQLRLLSSAGLCCLLLKVCGSEVLPRRFAALYKVARCLFGVYKACGVDQGIRL